MADVAMVGADPRASPQDSRVGGLALRGGVSAGSWWGSPREGVK